MSDVVLSALVLFGILQLAWFSVMMLRRGIAPDTIQHAIPPLLAIWVLMWPVYTDSRWLWIGVALLALLSLAAVTVNSPFWQHLRAAWTWSPDADDLGMDIYFRPNLPPLTQAIASIFIAALWFQAIPEFGFGLALCFCLAFPAAALIDRFGSVKFNFRRLGFPAHPSQTLAGHLILIAACTILLCWSLHVYHGTDWQILFIATLIAAMTTSASRAVVPGRWNAPAAMFTTGAVMWLL
ncbi:hypothetical protein Ga0123462_1556 [Mariprofundus ferrinatatus]|uniref:Phytol kinase n=2 Tax=Mariprofundus ferrinatatus TaxID=1921087 RepID=A0A2K8L517_9PROT|nr:hypothetical protein Ga0123462_1556 [Mariprofundus ferrinatatus]